MNALSTVRLPEVQAGGQLAQTSQEDMMMRYIRFLDVKPETARSYWQALRSWRGWLAEKGIQNPDRADVLAYRDEMKAVKAAGTVQTYVTGIKLFYRWAAIEGLYPNISDHVKGAKVGREHKRDYLTADQSRDLLSSIDRSTIAGLRDYAVILLMIACGLRDMEVAGALIGDLSLKAGSIVLYVHGKGRDGKEDFVKIPPVVEKAIRKYLQVRGEDRETAPMFVSESRNSSAGSAVSPRSISALVKRRMKAAGYDSKRLTAHSLRHTAVTLSLLAGQDLRDVSQFARHADISTTEIYDHSLQMDGNTCSESVVDAIFKQKRR